MQSPVPHDIREYPAMPETSKHFIQSYELELTQLRALLIQMGNIAETQLASAMKAVLERDSDTASGAVEADPKVDALEHEIEQSAIRLIALRQPVAADLRLIIGALKASDDLERIGDYASNVAKRAIVLAQAPASFSLVGLAHMAELVQRNLHRMVAVLDDSDPAVIAEIWRADKEVDDMYNSVFRELMTYMLENAHNITPCTYLLFIARSLERIGDHTTNVAETIYYARTGEELSGPRPKSESEIYLPKPPI